MNRRLFKSILSRFSIPDIEYHLIAGFMAANELDYSRSGLLKEYISGSVLNNELEALVGQLYITDLNDLESYMELLIPDADKKINGAFFTPDYIVDFIVRELSPSYADRNLDMSCGCGAFLIGLISYYRDTFGKSVRSIVRDNLYGSDILPYNIYRAKLLIAIYALQYGEYLELSDFNLTVQDSILSDWGDLKFENVLGNPPYVKFQDLSESSRIEIARQCGTLVKGTYNLYYAFFELGYKLLADNGQLGYITPNNYFTSLAAEGLRRFFHNERCLRRIVDFGAVKVFSAQTYTAITFLSRSKNKYVSYNKINPEETPQKFLATLSDGSPNYYSDLDCKKWRMLKSEDQCNVRRIETDGTPLGKMFDICVGIATLKDDLFFVDDNNSDGDYIIKTTSNGIFEIERSVTRLVYKVPDLKIPEDINRNTRRIIYPYIDVDGVATPIPENVFASRYPGCYAYLVSEKETLLKRDKGKVKYVPFYVWGRTQGLNRVGRKILTPTFSQYPRFMEVKTVDSFFTNGYGLFFKNWPVDGIFNAGINPLALEQNVDVLLKILNSGIMHYYVSVTSVSIDGDYPCYQKNFIEKFAIPDFSNDEVNRLRNMDSEQDITEFLCGKYQLKFPIPNRRL